MTYRGNTFKAYLTKYALTSGIMVVDAEECLQFNGDPYSSRMIAFKFPGGTYTEYAHGEGKDWHLTPESAITRAETMRTKKIAALQKQIKKLESMTFEIKE